MVPGRWFRAWRETECDVNEVTFGLILPARTRMRPRELSRVCHNELNDVFLARKRAAREHRERPTADRSRDNRRPGGKRDFSFVTFFPARKSRLFLQSLSRAALSSRYLVVTLPPGPFVPRMSAYEKEIHSVTKFENFSLCQETISFCLSLFPPSLPSGGATKVDRE